VDYQKSTVGETVKLCEALAFRFPIAMARVADAMAEFSAMELQVWWRALSVPAGGLLGAMWPQWMSGADLESVSMEVEQIRAELRSDTARRNESDAAATARFDHLQDQLTALRGQISTLRGELKNALAKTQQGGEIDQLRSELNALREQLHDAVNETQSAPAPTALAELQTELRALRDKMESEPPAGPEPEQGKNRKRPRR
jgi:septal ring factor EnvC (AmiA/AmiB activator)